MADEPIVHVASESYSDYTINDRLSVFGGERDLWGADSLTRAQLEDPEFKIAFDANLGAGLLRADRVKVEVFFDVPRAGVQNEPIYNEYVVGAFYSDGDFVWAIADNGTAHQYLATGTGNTSGSLPVFPSRPGNEVVDGDITWVESGVYQPAALPPYYASGLLDGAIGRGPSGNRIFIVTGQKGVIRTSLDGDTWTDQDFLLTDFYALDFEF